MKVGDYVRTEYGIEKIIDIKEWVNFKGYEKNISTDKNRYETIYEQSKILKSSPVIIDLIKIGDYVNGMKITNKYIDKETGNIELEFNNGSSYLYPKSWNYEARSKKYKIKSIVTKEQFSQMEYRIGE